MKQPRQQNYAIVSVVQGAGAHHEPGLERERAELRTAIAELRQLKAELQKLRDEMTSH